MKSCNEIKSLILPNNGGTIVLIPEGINNKILKKILQEKKNKIILLGNSVGNAIFEDYKLKVYRLNQLANFTKEKIEVYS